MNDREGLTLTEFKVCNASMLRAFTSWWRQQQEREPERYPDRLPPGEWSERIQDWLVQNKDSFNDDGGPIFLVNVTTEL